MTEHVEKRVPANRRLVIGGVAGMLVVALGAAAVAAPAAFASADAVMLESSQATVADAVAMAEAQHSADVAAAEAHAAQVAAQQQAVVDLALAQVGDAYVYGASGPNSFDCSGFTMWVYQQALGVSLPHNTHAQWNAIDDTWYVGEKEPQPGDLVFFFDGADHVGLYIGNGMMVHAENPGTGVIVSPIYEGYWADNLTGFGRIIH